MSNKFFYTKSDFSEFGKCFSMSRIPINLNLLYFCLNIKRDKNILGITNVSSLKQYEELKYRFIEVNKLLKDNSFVELIRDFSSQGIYFYKDCRKMYRSSKCLSHFYRDSGRKSPNQIEVT